MMDDDVVRDGFLAAAGCPNPGPASLPTNQSLTSTAQIIISHNAYYVKSGAAVSQIRAAPICPAPGHQPASPHRRFEPPPPSPPAFVSSRLLAYAATSPAISSPRWRTSIPDVGNANSKHRATRTIEKDRPPVAGRLWNTVGVQPPNSIHVAFSSVYLSKACSDLSRPLPDCL